MYQQVIVNKCLERLNKLDTNEEKAFIFGEGFVALRDNLIIPSFNIQQIDASNLQELFDAKGQNSIYLEPGDLLVSFDFDDDEVNSYSSSIQQIDASNLQELFDAKGQNSIYLEPGDLLVSFDFDDDEVNSYSSSIQPMNRLEISKMLNFVHDFTFNIISEDTDKRLDKAFSFVVDGLGDLTPDLIYRDGSFAVVIEFTTMRGRDDKMFKEAYKNKTLKYMNALDSRAKHESMKIFFGIIVVGDERIYTNLYDILSYEIVRELILRFKIAQNLEYELIEKGFLPEPAETERTLLDKQIIKSFYETNMEEHFKIGKSGNMMKTGDVWSLGNYKKFLEDFKNQKDEDTCFETMKKEFLTIFNEKKEIINDTRYVDNKDKDRILSKSLVQNYHDYKRLEMDYIRKFEKGDRTLEQRTIVQYPLLIPKLTKQSLEIENLCWLFSDNEDDANLAEYKMFKNCFFYSQNNPDAFETIYPRDIDEDNVNIVLTKLKQKPKVSKYRYHRVRTTIPRSFQEELKAKGISTTGRTNYHDSVTKLLRSKTRVPLGFETDTSDVDDFINLYSTLLFETNLWSSSDVDGYDLMIESLKVNRIPKENLEELQNYYINLFGCRLIRYCSFLSDLALELIISLKQNCKRDQFIFKKLLNYDVYLMIKPSSSEGLLSYSLMIPKTGCDMIFNDQKRFGINSLRVFKQLYEFENFYISEFVSTNSSRVTNLLTVHSRMISIISWQHDLSGLKPLDISFFMSTNNNGRLLDIKKTILFLLLVQLTDKTETEIELTRSRFSIMEGFVSYPEVPKPQKMFPKMSTIPKNRLTLYVIKKLMYSMKRLTKGWHYFRDGGINLDEDSRDIVDKASNWKNLSHPILHYKILHPGELINCMYYGYLNNKDRKMEKNRIGLLFEKIIGMENKFYQLESSLKRRAGQSGKLEVEDILCDSIIGACLGGDMKEVDERSERSSALNEEARGDGCLTNKEQGDLVDLIGIKYMDDDDYKGYHIYDPRFLRLGCRVLLNLGIKYHGPKFKNLMETEILRNLGSLTFERDLLTLKASSNFSERYENFKTNQKYSRSKVIEKTIGYMNDDKLHVFQHVNDCADTLIEKGCLHIDIFNKNQFGDPREIYVLGYEERICQLYIETISKSICKFFSSETMTNPKSKSELPDNHSKTCNRNYAGESFVTVGCSDDAEKWNQGHYVSKFYQMLILLTPEYMHALIRKILILWMNKKIKVNQEYLDLIVRVKNIKTDSEELTQLMDGFHGISNDYIPWIGKGKGYIQIRTGMMQGILHYTSSLLHTIVQELYRRFCFNVFNSSQLLRGRSIITIMQSSDDSSAIFSLPVKGSYDLKESLILISSLQIFKNKLGLFYGIYPSVKCTKNTINVVEFNSSFYFDDSKYQAYCKQLFSSMLCSEQESLQMRQEEMSNLITDLVSNGCSLWVANVVQVAQAMLYYRFMGCGISPVFKVFSTIMNKIKDPACGFFLMDNPFLPGYLGFKYYCWQVLSKTDCSVVYKRLLNEVNNIQTDLKLEGVTGSALTRKMIISYGNRMRWTDLVNSSNLDEDWQTKINTEPSILYRSAITLEELKLKIAIKLHSPGIHNSFNTGNNLPKIVASSVYVLTEDVVLESSSWFTKVSSITTRMDYSKDLLDDLVYQKDGVDNYFTKIPDYDDKDIEIEDNIHYQMNNFHVCLSKPMKKFSTGQLNIYLDEFHHEEQLAFYYTKDVESIVVKSLKSEMQFNELISVIEDYRLKGYNDLRLDQTLSVYMMVKLFKLMFSRHMNDNDHYYITFPKSDPIDIIFKSKWSTLSGEHQKKSLLKLIIESDEILRNERDYLTLDDLKFLFPMHEDYELKYNELNNYNFGTLLAKQYKKRSINTNVSIFGYEKDKNITNTKILSDYWFGTNYLKVSSRFKEKLFNDLKLSCSWLDESPSKTLSKSPFSSHLQLKNWFSTETEKDRRLNILGVPVAKISGASTMIQLIKNSYSSSFTLTGKNRESSEQSLRTTDITNQIYRLISLPINGMKKTEHLTALLQHTPEIKFNHNRIKSRINNLSIMQMVAKEGSLTRSSVLLQKLYSNGKGIIGGYDEPQNKNAMGKYQGLGSWKGRIDKFQVRIILDSIDNNGELVNVVKGVFVEKHFREGDLKSLAEIMVDWARDNHCIVDYKHYKKLVMTSFENRLRRADSDGVAFKHTPDRICNIRGTSFCKSNEGYYVIRVFNTMKRDSDLILKNPEVKVINNVIYLIANVGMMAGSRETKTVKIIRFQPQITDYRVDFTNNLDHIKYVGHTLIQTSLKGDSMSFTEAYGFMKFIMENQNKDEIEGIKIKEAVGWIKEQLIGSLDREGLYKGRVILKLAASDATISEFLLSQEPGDDKLFESLNFKTLFNMERIKNYDEEANSDTTESIFDPGYEDFEDIFDGSDIDFEDDFDLPSYTKETADRKITEGQSLNVKDEEVEGGSDGNEGEADREEGKGKKKVGFYLPEAGSSSVINFPFGGIEESSNLSKEYLEDLKNFKDIRSKPQDLFKMNTNSYSTFLESEPRLFMQSNTILRMSKLLYEFVVKVKNAYGPHEVKNLINNRIYSEKLSKDSILDLLCFYLDIRKEDLKKEEFVLKPSEFFDIKSFV